MFENFDRWVETTALRHLHCEKFDLREERLRKHASPHLYNFTGETSGVVGQRRTGASRTSQQQLNVISRLNFIHLAEMTLPYGHSVTTLRTVTVAEPSKQTVLTSPVGLSEGSTTYRTVNLSGAQYQPVQYMNSQVEGNFMYGGARYLVPVQQQPAESYVYVRQAPRVVQPVYLQNVQPVSLSSVDETDVRQVNINGQTTVFSQLSSPVKSPEPSESELVETSSIHEEVLDLKQLKNGISTEIKTEIQEPVAKLDNRFFGELLAEVYRKNVDIQTCISEHVAKIRGRKHLLDSTIDYKMEKEEFESLIPKGVSELTKQQIRYLLQTRMTADKTMHLVMTTFSSLREELVHMQEDLRRLESEKEDLERDLNFKADQAQQYDRLLETVREQNRQLQMSLKESNNAQRTLESQLLTFQSKDPTKDFRIKELEGSKRALEQENELLRKKLAGQCSSSTIQIKTQELSREYEKMLNDLREEKDKELKSLRSQLIKIQSESTIIQTTDTSSLELRISELLSKLEQRESVIRHQEEEIRRLKLQKTDSSSSSTRTVVTKRYMNQYPILGLLSDDYQYTAPIKEDRTMVIERTGEVKTRII
uniref:POF1B actin binding protein n=1 Tax=Danio rerio TaxID=7955 RepID=A0A2R8PYS8_DANRE|nr:protein POF1B [Danio rerio]|eukprot:XP_002666105.5 protein POF1B [Danio rerio]